MMKRFLLTSLLSAALSLTATAGPVYPVTQTVKQPDGTELTVKMRGDEFFHFYETLDGIPVVRNAAGAYVYARREANALTATDRLAHTADLRNADEQSFISLWTASRTDLNELGKAARATKMAPLTADRNAGIKVKAIGDQPVGGWKGKKKGLVILVNFTDVKFRPDHTPEVMNNMFNQEGFNFEEATGSVRDYFKAQSYGQFDVEFDVVGPVTVSNTMAYYGANGTNGDDVRASDMVKEAAKLADDIVDYKDYDWDGDGEVENFYVLYAGEGEAYTGSDPNTIWPHAYYLRYGTGSSLRADGVTVNRYACGNELHTNTTQLQGIGTPTHEFSHCLFLPDFYDIDYSGGTGTGFWDVMDSGCHLNNSKSPCGYTAYERSFCGWLELRELDEGKTITQMKPLTQEPEAYVVYNQANRNEYYILENRQQEGTDAQLYGHGLLVFHIDYNRSAWINNGPNDNPSHQRCFVVAADGNSAASTISGIKGDPFPGTRNVTALTDYTRPAATLYNANSDGTKFLHRPIEQISEVDGLISFVFNGGSKDPAPEIDGAPAQRITSTAFRAAWKPVEGALTYTVESNLAMSTSGIAPDMLTDFSALADGLTADETTSIASSLDSYLSVPGWTGYNLFKGLKGLKVGKSGSTGYAISPTMQAPETGTVTVYILAHPEVGATKTLKIYITNATGVSIAPTQTIVMNGTPQVVNFEGIGAPYMLKFLPAARGYLEKVAVYNGTYTLDEVGDPSAGGATGGIQTAEGLTSCYLDFTNLEKNATYRWRVRAEKAEAPTMWSDWQEVVLSDNAAIHELTIDNLSPETEVTVYSIDGRMLRRSRVAGWNDNLPAGTYLLQSAEGVAKAVNGRK